MDEELKKILDEAHAAGASLDQLQGLVDEYNKKKSQPGTPSSNGSIISAPASSDGSTNVIPDLLKPHPSSAQADGTSLLQQNKADIDSVATGKIPIQYQPTSQPVEEDEQSAVTHPNGYKDYEQQAADENAEDQKAGGTYTPSSIVGSFNKGLAHIPDALAGVTRLMSAIDNIGKSDNEKSDNVGTILFDWAGNYLRGTAKDNPLPNTFVGNTVDSTVGLIPTIVGASATGGESAAAEFSPYLSKIEILQTALTKAASPLTKYLATTKTLEGLNTGYKSSGGDFKQTLYGGIEGFNEGVESGITLEAQMAAGGKIGSGLFKKMVSSGILKEDGVLTEQALKSFIGSPLSFATGSVADDLSHGRPIDWKNAGVSAVTALPFEAPHVFEAYHQSQNIKATKDAIDKKVNEAINVRDNNAIVNFSNAEPGDLLTAMQRPETSQELQVMAIEKGIAAQKDISYQDKNTLHVEQMELQQQADIKKLGEVVINKGVDGFIEAVYHTELPDATKTELLKRADAINNTFNPVEVKKNDLGKTIEGINTQIQDLHKSTFNNGQANVTTEKLVQLNDLIGKRVQTQNDLFRLTYGDNEKQKESVDNAKSIIAEKVTNPATNNEHNPIVPVSTDFIKDAFITDVKYNGDVTIRQKDGKEETITDENRKALGITDDHIKQFTEANKQPEPQQTDTGTKIPVKEAVPIDLTRHEGETDFEHRVRTSSDPNELATMYDDKISDLQNNLGVDGAIADYRATVQPHEFYEHDDRNNVTPAIARNYFHKKGTRAIGIDSQAQEINNIYFNGTETVQPADITDFMVRYPAGHQSYFTPAGNDDLAAINDRYKEITGKNLRKDVARKLAEKYQVSNKVAEDQAKIINGPHVTEALEKRIDDLVHTEGTFTGLPDYDKIHAEFDKYVDDHSNEWNIWHDVFNGQKPNEHDIELTKRIIDERRTNQGSGEGTGEKPDARNEDSTSQPAAQSDSSAGVTTSATEPERVAKEYDQIVADHDEKITKAENALKKAEDGINEANDLFASSGSADDGKKDDGLFKQPADVSKENTDRILKPLHDQVEKLKSERESILAEKDKAVEQAGRQTQFNDEAASHGQANEKIDPVAQEAVKGAMTNLFPNIKTHYYANIENFNKAVEATPLRDVMQAGNVVHAFVDKNREIHFNPEYLTKDTQIHEQGHILSNWAYHYSPELYKRMIEAGKTMGDLHKELRQNGYDGVKGNPFFEEAFVTALGREGAGKLDEIIKGREQRSAIKRFIHEAWTKLERWIAGRTGFSVSKFKNLQDMTVDEFTKYLNEKYLFSDVKISDISSEELSKKNNPDIKSDDNKDFKAQASSKRPERAPGETLSDYAKRVADWTDENDRRANEDKQTPPDKIVGGTNATQVMGGDWELPPETKAQELQRKGQDAMNRVKVTQKAIEEAGNIIDRNTDYYNHQRRVTALAEHQIDLAHEDIFKSKDKKKPALFELMKDKGVSQTDLGLYLYAKHAEERNRENASARQVAYNAEHDRVSKRLQEAKDTKNKKNETYFKNKLDILEKNENKKYPLMNDGGSGMTNAQAKEVLANFESDGRTADLEQLAQKYKADVTDKQLQYDLDSGRISQDDFDALKAKYKNYVPLQVQEYVDAKNTISSMSNLIKVKNAFQRAQGSVARDFNQRVNPLSYGIVQLERSIVEGEKNKLLNTFYNLVEENPNEKVWEIIQPKYKATYKADGSIDKLDNITDERIKKNSLYGFREGRPFYIHIKDDILRREINREGFAFKGTSVAEVLDKVNAVSGFLRNGLTVYNPAFWVPNFVKDTFSASFNLSTQKVDGLVGKYIKSIPSAMNGIIQYNKGNRDHPDAKVFKQYLENGAELTYSRYDLDIDKLQNIADYFKKSDKSSWNPTVWVPKLGEYLNHCSELLELTNRVAAFKGAIDSGIPEHEAAVLSKEATVDFSQKGEWSPVFNALYLFSNAGVQGGNIFFKNLAKSPKSAGKILAASIAAGVFSAAFNQMTNGTPNQDGSDDENDYNRISESDKQGNLIIRNVMGGGFFKIPVGHELGFFPYLGDKIFNYVNGHSTAGETTVDVTKYALSAYSPVGGGSLAQIATPTIIDPFVQFGENQNAFGSPIYKKTDANANIPQSQSHFKSTDPIYVAIADKLHKWTGGTGAKKGYIEIPPDVIPWAIQTATGGAGKTLTQTVDAVGNSIRLQPTEVKQIPVLYRFYTTGNAKNYKSSVISILDASGTTKVSAMDQTKFYQDAMKAVLKGEIDDKTYEKYLNTFERNKLRIQISEQYPDATPDQLKEMMK